MSEGTYSENQLRDALKAYGLIPNVISCMTKGNFAEVYRVTYGTDVLVVRVRSLEAMPEHVLFASQWAKVVAAEVSVPVPLSPLGDVPKIDSRCVDVAPYIENDQDGGDVGPDAWIEVGNWLGRMHRLGKQVLSHAPVALDYGNYPHSGLFHRYLNQARLSVSADHVATMKRAERLIASTEPFIKRHLDRLPVGVVHGDMHFWNVLYAKDKPVAIIDFDFLQRGILLCDIAYACIWLTGWERERGGEWLGIMDRYISAYEEGRGMVLNDAERACLPYLRVWDNLFSFIREVAMSWGRLEKALLDLNAAESLSKEYAIIT